jgi:hypothetical protein
MKVALFFVIIIAIFENRNFMLHLIDLIMNLFYGDLKMLEEEQHF